MDSKATTGRTPALMIQGTGSGVGKSLLVSALCRTYSRMGFAVRPFKAQNMSNNAAATINGGEIGRAQALQARAAGIEPDERMNPVLLKPMADTRSEVVVMGRGRPDLADLHWHERRESLWGTVCDAYRSLEEEAELILVEGAGSPAEINLRQSDIVNMSVAREWNIPVVLVADIDRGGAFASLYGTWALLDREDRRLIRAFLLNKFRGDPALLEPAPAELENLTGVPTLGAIPWIHHLLPEEDGQMMERTRGTGAKISAIRLPYLSNYDDLDPLLGGPDVEVNWATRPEELADSVAVVIPGTRNTIADLHWLRDRGLASEICKMATAGVPIVGLCGGLQMLGTRIVDRGVEEAGDVGGLGLLPVETTFDPKKEIRQTKAVIRDVDSLFEGLAGTLLSGYEIHHGHTTALPGSKIWLQDDDRILGVSQGEVWGVYFHGIFGNDAFRRSWLERLGIDSIGAESWDDRLDRELDQVADSIQDAVDMNHLLALARREL